MSCLELFEHIQHWLWSYDHVPLPNAIHSPIKELNDSAYHIWRVEMFIEIASWNVPIELKGTSVEKSLNTVIDYARAEDRTKIQEIHDLLICVLNYIVENRLCTNTVRHN